MEIAVPDGESHYFFLASVVKKPVVQVLVRGFKRVSDDGTFDILCIEPGSAPPVMSLCTGHQAFHQLCVEQQTSRSLEKLDMWPITYQLNPFAPLLQAKIISRGDNHKLLTKMPRQAQSQCILTMPFGLARPKRKRANAKSGRKKKAARANTASSFWGAEEVLHELQADAQTTLQSSDEEEAAEVAQNSDCSQSVEESECADNISSAASEPEAAEIDFEDNEKAGSPSGIPVSLNLRKPAEEMLTPPSRKEDEKQVSKLQCDRAARIQSMSSNPKPVSGMTFCNKTLGLVEAGIQKAARLATCRHCLSKIERGSVRFGYSYHLKKFHSWLHSDCACPHLIQEDANLDQAKDFLANLLKDDAYLEASVRESAKSLQRQLLSHTGESSSSGVHRNI